jgi:hypothetical protein
MALINLIPKDESLPKASNRWEINWKKSQNSDFTLYISKCA